MKYFADYNESTTETRLSSLDSNKIQGRSGKYLTEQDLFPMTPVSGQPIFEEQPNMTPAPSSTPAAPFTGGGGSGAVAAGMTFGAPQTNRQTGIQRHSGQEQFDIKTGQLFSGKPSP